MKIKAGPELDRAVAEAINWEGGECPAFSTNINATYHAAEKSGLWERGRRYDYPKAKSYTVSGKGLYSTASTPALAICGAILQLKERK